MTNSESDLTFVADLGGTHLRAATVNRNGKLHHRLKRPTPSGGAPAEIVQALVDAAHECKNKFTSGQEISAVSVAVPGTVDFKEGLVVTSPNVPCLEGFRLGAALQNELNLPAIVENDANAAAVGEMWRGSGRGYRDLICITLGTGVGGGIILNGELWRGSDGSAGEIGHLAVDPSADVPCSCGSRGCLEVYASARAIVRMIREAGPRYPNSSLDISEGLTSEKVYEAGLQGDELSLDVFRRMGLHLGIGLASLINVINPEIIVIGGGVADGWELFEKDMNQQARERAFPVPAERVRISRAECGDDAGLLGAARLAFVRLR